MRKPSPIPAFTPVPRRHDRHDGWTPVRQTGFIAALADTGCVSRAAKAVGKSPESAYALRRAPGAEGFRAAWTAALGEGVQRLADVAFERALEGVPVPIFHRGEQVGERRVYNDRLLMFTLRHHDAGRYGDGGARGNALSPATHRALRAQWAAEREAVAGEVRQRRALKMIRDDLLCAVRLSDKFTLMRERMTGEPAEIDANGNYVGRFRSELEAFDRLYPDVCNWQAEDTSEAEGWPAADYLKRLPSIAERDPREASEAWPADPDQDWSDPDAPDPSA